MAMFLIGMGLAAFVSLWMALVSKVVDIFDKDGVK